MKNIIQAIIFNLSIFRCFHMPFEKSCVKILNPSLYSRSAVQDYRRIEWIGLAALLLNWEIKSPKCIMSPMTYMRMDGYTLVCISTLLRWNVNTCIMLIMRLYEWWKHGWTFSWINNSLMVFSFFSKNDAFLPLRNSVYIGRNTINLNYS